DVVLTPAPDEAARLAREAAADGYGVVVAAGGDGTANEVANGLVGSGAVLALYPIGVGNDVARALGYPRRTRDVAPFLPRAGRGARGRAGLRPARRAHGRRPLALVLARRAGQALPRDARRREGHRPAAGAHRGDRARAAAARGARRRGHARTPVLDPRAPAGPGGARPMSRADPRRALPSVDAVLRAAQPSEAERERLPGAAPAALARARDARRPGGARG